MKKENTHTHTWAHTYTAIRIQRNLRLALLLFFFLFCFISSLLCSHFITCNIHSFLLCYLKRNAFVSLDNHKYRYTAYCALGPMLPQRCIPYAVCKHVSRFQKLWVGLYTLVVFKLKWNIYWGRSQFHFLFFLFFGVYYLVGYDSFDCDWYSVWIVEKNLLPINMKVTINIIDTSRSDQSSQVIVKCQINELRAH